MGAKLEEPATPKFVATFTPCTSDAKKEPHQALKALLKAVLRGYGFRCISIEQQGETQATSDIEDMF